MIMYKFIYKYDNFTKPNQTPPMTKRHTQKHSTFMTKTTFVMCFFTFKFSFHVKPNNLILILLLSNIEHEYSQIS
jgi:hypothetical protein